MLLAIEKHIPHNPQSGKPDVILIHGTGANAALWEPQIKLLLQQGYRCFVPELRGHGQTEEPGHTTSIEDHIQDLIQTLQHCEVEFPAIFVGHSLGAIIAMELAHQQNKMFVKILAISMPGKVLPIVSKLFGLMVSYPFEPLRGTRLHRSLSKRHQALFSTHRHSLNEIVDNFKHIDFVNKKLNILCPVHFSVGRLDWVAPYFYVLRMHRALPNSTLRIFEWAGHCCMDDQPEQFNEWFMEKILLGPVLQEIQ